MNKLLLLVVGGIALVIITVVVLVSVFSVDTKSENVVQQKEESMENQKNVGTVGGLILRGHVLARMRAAVTRHAV